MIRLNKITINSIGPIKSLELSFNDHFNIICGVNGIGKTTLLQCLAGSFGNHTIKKTVGEAEGSWNVFGVVNGSPVSQTFKSEATTATEHPFNRNRHLFPHARDVIVFRAQRDIVYSKLPSISADPEKDDGKFANETFFGSNSSDIKAWFVNRHLWSKHDDALTPQQIDNLSLAKGCFQLLDSRIQFSRVDSKTNDIMVITPKGEIFFEYLSSGFQAGLAILLGLIKDLEYRSVSRLRDVKDFDGLIIIDELDSHLHPSLQALMYSALKQMLPNAQFFISTHSPHIVQIAESNEIIPLVFDENGDVSLNDVAGSQYGCQGWTVEEILTDVMGMKETRTTYYQDLIQKFNSALDNEDLDTTRKMFAVLDKMLHANNSLRKVLKIQMSGLQSND